MSSIAILVYLLAIGISVYLLHHFHSRAWYWHLLAILGALGIGLIPTPQAWKTTAFDLIFGFVIALLLVWGLGGLLVWRPHRERHA
jgi:hypothetical protein